MDLPDRWISALVLGILKGRQVRRSSYSLRALARDLKIDPSVLSKLLRGKRGWSSQQRILLSQFLERIGQSLGPVESEFRNLEEVALSRALETGAQISSGEHPPELHEV